MSKFYDTVIEVLKQDERFFTEEGELLRNAVYEASIQMDNKLIKALYENEETHAQFFTDIDGISIFDKVGFGWVINNKQFLPDSFTRYKNKIGLVNSKGNFISSSKDVELVFPYKDCILEGGQTKEDQKRSEIFYNETLAPDEVDRLLYPKVFTNAKRYTADGIEEVTEFQDSDNLVIKGNNLLVISSLLKNYEGKIKLIYIDPPYNTGSDSFSYNDSFNRSSWLTFMKNRLEIARRLLTNDGAIYVQLDYHQVHYAKVLMDEIFGEDNFQREIIWRIGWLSGYKTADNNWI
ncbi:MAG: site-specific DNA-methyltransferase, partial [Sedimentibacter sp.]